MNKKEEVKHRHHKQPQYYLKGFSTGCACPQTPANFVEKNKNETIWVYEKGKPFSENNPKCKGIPNVGFTKDFYAFEDDDGTINFTKYENLLMRDFEQPVNPIIKKVRNFEEVSDEDKEKLSKYITSMIIRGDWWRSIQDKTVREVSESIKEKYLSIFSKKEVQEIIIKTVETSSKKFADKKHKLESAIDKINDLSNVLKKMNMIFLVAPQNSFFVTADTPVYYFHLDKTEGEVIFPLSSKIVISLSWKLITSAKRWDKISKQFWQVDAKTVDLARHLITQKAIKEIYCSKKAEWFVKFINNRN